MSWEKCVCGSSPSCARPARGGFEPTPVKAALGLEAFLSKHLLDFSALSTLTAQSRQLTQPLWAHLLLCESAYPLGHCGNHNGVPSEWQTSTCCYKQRGKPAAWPTVLGWPGPRSLPLRGLVVTICRNHEFCLTLLDLCFPEAVKDRIYLSQSDQATSDPPARPDRDPALLSADKCHWF